MPPVIEPDTFGADDEDAPTVLWLPTACEWHGGEEGPGLELREVADGDLALLAFTSLKALELGCGSGQPYITVLPQAIDEILYAVDADLVLWDAVLDPSIRHGTLAEHEGDE
ncbi:MAG: SAV_915 family protein [Thermocrispum sp.]